MGDRTSEYKFKACWHALQAVQLKVERKYGERTIFKWRQARLNRPKKQYTPKGF